MTNQTNKPQALFPDFPRDQPAVDKDGNFTASWDLGLNQVFQTLQQNFKNEGYVFPPLTIDQINAIQAIYTPFIGRPLPQNTPSGNQVFIPDISGQTVFDSTNRIPKMFIITYDISLPPNVTSASWLILNVMLNNAGNPNGTVAGALNWFCFDTTNKVLYICTTPGAIGIAVWTAV